MNLPRRQKGGYFPHDPDAPPPIIMRLEYRIRFSDVDPMGVLWHGRYAHLFEQANEEIGRAIGMSYSEFRAEKTHRSHRAVSRGLFLAAETRRSRRDHRKADLQ